MWHTDGSVGMTGCLCIHHKYKTCGFKHRQTGRLQYARLVLGWWEPNECHTQGGIAEWSLRAKQLSVALPSFVWDDWGDNHWFPSIGWSYCPPACLTLLVKQSGWGNTTSFWAHINICPNITCRIHSNYVKFKTVFEVLQGINVLWIL